MTRMRAANAIPMPKIEPGFTSRQRADVLGIASSHPTWLVERWVQRFGEATALKLLASNNRCARFSFAVMRSLSYKSLSNSLAAHHAKQRTECTSTL